MQRPRRIYTDELQFYSHNVDQAKVILEGGTTHVNVKNNPERLMRRTPCLSTSNTDPWLTIPNEEPNLKARMPYYNMQSPMTKLKYWGAKKLTPRMWIILWKTYIEQWENKIYNIDQIDQICPIPSPKNQFRRGGLSNTNQKII